MKALVALIGDIKAAQESCESDTDLALARNLQRHAEFRLDFLETESSTGFHAPEEAARILAESINLSRQGQLAVRDPAYRPEFTNETAVAARTPPAGPAADFPWSALIPPRFPCLRPNRIIPATLPHLPDVFRRSTLRATS